MHAAAAAAPATAAAAAAAVRAWAPHQEKSICENWEDLPARVVFMARDTAMQLPAAGLKRQVVAAKHLEALRNMHYKVITVFNTKVPLQTCQQQFLGHAMVIKHIACKHAAQEQSSSTKHSNSPVSWLIKVCHHKWKVEQQHVDLHTTSQSCIGQYATHCMILSYEVKEAYQNDCKHIPDAAESPLQNCHSCCKVVCTFDASMNHPFITSGSNKYQGLSKDICSCNLAAAAS